MNSRLQVWIHSLEPEFTIVISIDLQFQPRTHSLDSEFTIKVWIDGYKYEFTVEIPNSQSCECTV